MKIFKRFLRFWNKVFNPSKELPYNLYHPDINPNIELAFECHGKEYYRMKAESRMPTGRYKFIDAYLAEHEMRMTLPMMTAYLDKMEAILNGTAGVIKLGDLHVVVHNMRTHAHLGFDEATIQRLASVVYFDDTEDLRDYDLDYGKKKINEWVKEGKYSFFLTRPIDELLNIRGISIESLEVYIQQQRIILAELTSVQQTPSLDNSSESETLK
jgi:hypothetical protein